MTTDGFTEAARAEAERRTRPPGISGQTFPSMEQFAERDGYRRGFTDAAEWARTYLAAQEPTDAEVEALARMTTEEVSGCDWASFGEDARNYHRGTARRRLTAARAAVPQLLDRLDRAQAALDRVRKHLTAWVDEYGHKVYQGNGWAEGVRDAAREALKDLDGEA